MTEVTIVSATPFLLWTESWTHAAQLRRFTVSLPNGEMPNATVPPAEPWPVYLHLDCYSFNSLPLLPNAWGEGLLRDGARYSVAMFGLSTTQQSSQFDWANDGVVNHDQPHSCSADDSDDIGCAPPRRTPH